MNTKEKIQQLMRYILVGALSLLPLIMVLIVANYVKGIGENLYDSLHYYTDSIYLTIALIVGVIAVFAFLGYSLEEYGKSIFVAWIDKVFLKIPAVRTIYNISKKISDMFFSKEDSTKKEVVLVEFPRKNMWVVAYMLNRKDRLCVLYVPTSPNPTSGYTVMVDEGEIIKTTMTLPEASSFIISMGGDFSSKDEISALIDERNSRENL